MEAAHNPHSMASWEPLEVGTDMVQTILGEEADLNTHGLSASVENLHTEFHNQAGHLGEVQSMHQHVLVAAGMLPETHMADVEPSRQLKWMVEALHGQINPDGLTIPLLGVTAEDVGLYTKQQDEITVLKLVVTDGDNEPLEREMPLTNEGKEISAHYLNGRLYLRW
tara:strand:- start:6182 stop:6682 length:501 start_codon:yes stop_codon:yes gene_type:complete